MELKTPPLDEEEPALFPGGLVVHFIDKVSIPLENKIITLECQKMM